MINRSNILLAYIQWEKGWYVTKKLLEKYGEAIEVNYGDYNEALLIGFKGTLEQRFIVAGEAQQLEIYYDEHRAEIKGEALNELR